MAAKLRVTEEEAYAPKEVVTEGMGNWDSVRGGGGAKPPNISFSRFNQPAFIHLNLLRSL